MEAMSQTWGLGVTREAHGIWEEYVDTRIMNCARTPVSHVAGRRSAAAPAGMTAAMALAAKERGTSKEATGMRRKFTSRPMGCAW